MRQLEVTASSTAYHRTYLFTKLANLAGFLKRQHRYHKPAYRTTPLGYRFLLLNQIIFSATFISIGAF